MRMINIDGRKGWKGKACRLKISGHPFPGLNPVRGE